MIRVMVADDHPLLLEGLIKSLNDESMEVVCHTRNSEDIVGLYQANEPDVLITDIMFGDMKLTGLEVLSQILQIDHSAKVIMFSQYDSVELIKDAYSRGAKAYIPKSSEADFVEIIKKVLDGAKYFDQSVANKLAELAIREGNADQSLVSGLTDSELEIFKLIAEGFTQKEVAEKLETSLRTVNKVWASIREKLGFDRPQDITIFAIKNQLIDINKLSRRIIHNE